MSTARREIKIPYALKSGEWIHISQVESGLKANCVCPCCNKILLAKKGNKVVHHFAHYEKVSCNPETVLHFIAKHFLYQKIQSHLARSLPLNVSWVCKFCKKKHEANLLRRATKACLEHDLGDCRPDIALLAEGDKPVAVIEIVVTHKPEESAVAFYQKNKIALVECDVLQGTDLELFQSSEVLNASRVDRCTSPRCKKCGNPFSDSGVLYLVHTPCRRCKKSMKVAFIRPSNYDFQGPKDFSEREVSLAQQHGVLLEKKFSQTLNKTYFANTCPHCKSWIGEHFLPDYIPNENDRNSDWDEFLIGNYCYHCNRSWPCRVQQIRQASKHDVPKDYSQLKLLC